jgi:hypothetical protein
LNVLYRLFYLRILHHAGLILVYYSMANKGFRLVAFNIWINVSKRPYGVNLI